jgi:energy-coupling factor transporter ATP-binding protein EcfA2
LDEREEKYQKIEEDYPGEKLRIEDYKKRKQRLDVLDKWFNEKLINPLKELDQLCLVIRNRQPHLNELTEEHINRSSTYPDALSFGRLVLSAKNKIGYIPRLLRFPFQKSCWTDDYSELKFIHQLVLRLLHCLPVGKFEIIVVDPIKLGSSMKPFVPLLEEKRIFPNQRLLTRSDEVETMLGSMMDYIEDLIQNRFKGDIMNWSDYNESNKENKLPYKLLLLFDVPNQLSDKSRLFLSRILEHGPSCGILPVVTLQKDVMDEKKYEEFMKNLQRHATELRHMAKEDIKSINISALKIREEEEFWPNDQDLLEFIALIRNCNRKDAVSGRGMQDLWRLKSIGDEKAVSGIRVPVGWKEDGSAAYFEIGAVNSEHHVLLAGRSGSGKSNFLHVLILALCHMYSPSELNLYLLDYKQGTEFNVYVNPPLPQIKLVATESDPEYGVTVLLHLKNELEKRASTFKRNAVRDYYEYRKLPNSELPRVVLIIDEFQILFSENKLVAEQAEKLLNILLRQGRAYGIHIVLATQTLKGIQSLSMGQLISQIGLRIALACNEDDSAMILGSSNWEAAKLVSPPEGIINNSNGARSANQVFEIPFADRMQCNSHMLQMESVFKKEGYTAFLKVFNGSKLPDISRLYSNRIESGNDVILQLGELLTYDLRPFVIHLEKRMCSNLLIAGYCEQIQIGLTASIIHNLLASNGIDEIIYYDAVQRGLEFPFKNSGIHSGIEIRICHSLDEVGLTQIEHELNGKRRIIMINGLDYIKELQTGPSSYRPSRKEEIPPPSETFRKLLEEAPEMGTFVISFTENWKRLSTVGRDYMNLFDLRIGYQMNEEDAASFFSGGIGRLKGLESDKRAVFTDRLKNQVCWFRPYTVGERE